MTSNKYSFASAGKNRYFATEVDEYVRKSSEEYERLFRNFKALEKKLKTIGPAIEEYNNSKNTVFAAIVRAESYLENVTAQANESSAEIIKKASEEAENLLLTKKAEADAYYFNVTHEADERIIQLNKEIDTLEKRSEELKEKYICDTKEKAKEIIDNAKTKAAEIVAAAYHDAKDAKEKSEEIIAATTSELNRLKSEIAKYKNEIISVVATIKPAVDSISDDAEFTFVPTTIEVDTDNLADAMPEFSLDTEDYEETSEKPGYPDFYEDISSVSSPEYYGESETVSLPQMPPVPDLTEEINQQTMIFQDLGSAIFDTDDFDGDDIDFSYQPDFDAFFDDDITKD
jgi:cell division septum initiation protein DivIVA